MKKETNYISILEKILLHLKNAKLSYVKASDKAIFPEDKRHFNKHTTLRNRFFLEIQSILYSKNIELDDLIIENFNYDQLLISPLNKKKITACEKCILADKIIMDLYKSLEELEMMNPSFLLHVETISDALEKNETYLEKFPVQV